MSLSYHILVHKKATFEKTFDTLSQVVGHPLKPEENRPEDYPRYSADAFGIWIDIEGMTLELEDMGLRDADYCAVIGFTRFAGEESDHRAEMVRVLARYTGQALSRVLKCECVVLYEVDRIIEKYRKGKFH